MTSDSDTPPADGGPDGTTSASGVLRSLSEEGFDASFTPLEEPPGSVRCGTCGQASPAGSFEVADERRLEGASDPDDMVLIVAATCPACGARGAMVLAYGPEASAADSDVVAAMAAQELKSR